MNFPKGRLYTVQFTADELIWLLEHDVMWSEQPIDSPGYNTQNKIHEAKSLQQQDNAVAYLYDAEQRRNTWLKERALAIIKERDELREELCQLRENMSSGPTTMTDGAESHT